MIPDAGAMMQAAPKAAPAAAADKKLVFPTLNIDLPEDLEKAGVSRAGAKSPTMASQSAAAAPAAPSMPAISAAPPSDEDDDARTLIAHPSPSRGQTGPGPRVAAAPGGGLALAQTLASEIKEPDARPKGPSPAAGKPAAPVDDGPEITVGPVGDRPSAAAAAPAPSPPAASPTPTQEGGAAGLSLAATLPIGQAEVERAMQAAAAAAPARPPLGSMSEASSPGQNQSNPGVGLSAMSSSGGQAIAPPSQAVAPAPRSGISVATAMVLGALIGALVVGGIVVALVSMR